MSSINLGGQSVTFDFKQDATAEGFNALLRGIVKPGMYSGGTVTFLGNTISIAAFKAVFNLTNSSGSVAISTTTSISQTITPPYNAYLVMNYTWYDVRENWIDFEFKAVGDLLDTDIILCKITYSGANISSIDTTYRTEGLFDDDYNVKIDTGTASSSYSTGALVIKGGVGIAGDLFVGKPNWTTPYLIYESATLTGITLSSICPLLSNYNNLDIAAIDITNSNIQTYRVTEQTWASLGNSLLIDPSTNACFISSLDNNKVSAFDLANQTLSTYEFYYDETNWYKIGNSLSIPDSYNIGSVTSLNSGEVVIMYADAGGTATKLGVYSFNGTDWSQVGNTLSLNRYTSANIVSLNETDIVYCGGGDGGGTTSGEIATYRFDGVDLAQIGNSLNFVDAGSAVNACCLNNTDIAVCGKDSGITQYRFNGTNWTQIGYNFNITTINNIYTLNSTDFILFTPAPDLKLKTYRYGYTISQNPYIHTLLE